MAAPHDTASLDRELAEAVGGKVVYSKSGYGRIVAVERTLAYANRRRHGIELDFRAADVADAPTKARKRTTVKRDRALLNLGGHNEATRKGRVGAARTLLEHVAQKGQS